MKTAIQNKRRVLVISAIVSAFLLLVLFLIPTQPYFYFSQQLSADLLSAHCSIPHPGKPLIQYAIMIDAGSSGSRVHVYKFNFCQQEPELENEVFRMLEPGLSAYPDDPERAADSLEDLFKVAMETVPESMQSCTPIAVKATAGLRLLGTEKSKLILEAVRQRLETKYPFRVTEVDTMDGKDEGVYAWITVNYLLGNLKGSNYGKSAATFDLGGASTQIVFEPTFADRSEAMVPGDHVYQLDYAHHRFNLYQHSYLGFGLNEARKRIKQSVVELWQSDLSSLSGHNVYHPCLPENHTETIKYRTEDSTRQIDLIGTGAGHAACRGVIEKIFNKETVCPFSPCAFNGIYQPSLKDTFLRDRDLYVFSYFYDLTQPLGMPLEFSVRELGELSERVCRGEPEAFRHIPNALQAIKQNPDYCLDLTYTHALLRIGYEIPPDRTVRTAKKIRDAETGWCLGASIAMMNDNKLCRK